MMSDDEIIKKLEETTMNAVQLQRETLAIILERNGGVSYLQPYLQGYNAPVISAATFRRLVPLSSYEDYADYINRLADGVLDDDNGQPLMSFDNLLYFFYRLFPPRATAYKVLGVNYAGNLTQTKGGYKAMAASSYPFHSNERNLLHFLSTAVSPKEVILGSDAYQQIYCHLLCGLVQCDIVDGIRAPYAAGLIRAFSLFEAKWDQLCMDLENGFPSSSEITDLAMRESVIGALSGPQLDLSKRVRSICERQTWDGIISRLWPNARYIKTVTTGSMRQYYAKLKYYAGELPILGSDYFASECSVAINMDITQSPETTRYVMLPTGAYFEFLPFYLNKGCASNDEDTMDFSSVEVGKMYEVVVTTYRGLFRYRLGDIVKVVGFYNSSPQIEVVMRAPKYSDEIVTERDLLSAMAAGFQLGVTDAMAAEVVEFASFLDRELDPKQLKVFVEVKGCTLLQNEKSEQLLGDLRKCCSLVENGLCGIYKVMKAKGELGPLLLFVLKPGSFDRLFEEAVESGSPATQYKPPKIIRSRTIAELLESSATVIVAAQDL
ncbi:hypothetical protein ACH5RR_010711 [Cinchona calisaya]|uniref:Uncharacterized protein n=1 Tax=Cinchona calisaya TaxID=153742 RepID=A0ABD3AJP1_9GENT